MCSHCLTKKKSSAIKVTILILLLTIFSLPSEAALTYTYTGNPFTYAGNTVPDLLAYDDHNHIELIITTSDEINKITTSSSTLLYWRYSDGTQTFTSSEGIDLFKFSVTPSDPTTKVMEYWEIIFDLSRSGTRMIINTTNTQDGRVYDWGQNNLFNYGGNWSSPGTWNVTSAEAPIPIPPTIFLMGSGFIGLASLWRRNK